ncbi:hypothetical protein CHUAL_002446 [Chamberlinius hualienensis]
MLNSHMKSHSNVYQYRCNDCTYATKYCHSLKLHLRKYTHKPAVVLNPDGTPNPVPVIDVYGTRRGPRQKKSSDDQKAFGNGNGNTNGNGSVQFPPIKLPMNGALSPSTVIPYFFKGPTASIPNNYHSGIDTLLLPGSVEKLPNVIPSPAPLPNSHINSSNNGGLNGSVIENDNPDSEKIRNHSKGTAFKCHLCPFITDYPELYNKHILYHATADNRDLCDLYGISSESLTMEPNQQQQQQQQLNATAMAVMAALSISNGAKNDLHRQSITMTSAQHSPEVIKQDGDFQNGSNSSINNIKSGVNSPEREGTNTNGSLHMTTPLDHLRMFSEQEAAEKTSTSRLSPGENTQKASQMLKSPKDGAIIARNKSPAVNEAMNLNSGLGPLDLSNTKNGPAVQRVGTIYPQSSQHHSPRFSNHSPSSAAADTYDNLQVNTDGVSCTQSLDLISPTNQSKNRRKGKAFKLDRICMKLQKDYNYSDSASSELIVEDSVSVGDSDTRPRSSEGNNSDIEVYFKPAAIKVEVDHHSDSNSLQSPIKVMETNGNMTYGKKHQNVRNDKSFDKLADLKKSPSNESSPPIVTLNEGDDDEKEPVCTNGVSWKGAFECHHCEMAFKDCLMYTVHMGYHRFDNPFKCNMCGQVSSDKVSFFLHMVRAEHK